MLTILLIVAVIYLIIAIPLGILCGKSMRLADDTAKRPASEKETGRFACGDRSRRD